MDSTLFHGHLLEVDADARTMEIYCGGTGIRYSRSGDRGINTRNQYCVAVIAKVTVLPCESNVCGHRT